jgi:hypothetical protein
MFFIGQAGTPVLLAELALVQVFLGKEAEEE